MNFEQTAGGFGYHATICSEARSFSITEQERRFSDNLEGIIFLKKNSATKK